jgi:amino acid adenylation domain-containing protein
VTDVLTRRFLSVAERFPDRVAVRAPDETLTFAELELRSGHLARRLAGLGVTAGSRVGVHLPRTSGLVVALLAVWRSGAAYVPLDPAYPADRLRFVTRDAGLRWVVVDGAEPAGLGDVHAVQVDGPVAAGEAAGEAGGGPRDGADPAYVIHTSGTTGRPKGVVATTDGVRQLVDGLEQLGVYGAAPRSVAWNASISFDASVQQWARVFRGDTLVLIDEELRVDPPALFALLRELGVEDIDLTPSHFEAYGEELARWRGGPGAAGGPAPAPLRLLMGGEPIPARLWRTLVELTEAGAIECVNLYGPTEFAVDATARWLTGAEPGLGRPLPGVEAHVLDDRLRPVAPGTVGELYLAGKGIAHGYAGNPALTAVRFVADPRSAGGARMYRTGDRVRTGPDGSLVYVDRIDRQVKVRGHRVELGEIESVLEEHPGVRSAAVVVAKRASGADQLRAFYTPAGEGPDAAAVRDWCAERLPRYLLPERFVLLTALPKSSSGKVDARALADRPVDGDESGARPAAAAGGGQVLGVLETVWKDVLGVGAIGPDDNFFALGGHSLLAINVVNQVKTSFATRIRTKDVYQHPRLADLADFVSDAMGRN